MSFKKRLSSFPTRSIAVGSVLVLAIHTAWVVLFSWRRNTFVNDDIINFWRARTEPFAAYVLTPIDDHFVPLHRLICYLLLKVAPMNFEVGMAVLAVLHAATLLVLWLVLEELRSSPLNAVLVCGYGLQACLGPQFLWFTAGLGRLGCVFFSVLAMFCYLRFRTTRSRWMLLFTTLATAGALGSYAKGLFVPVHIAGLEIALWASTRSFDRRALSLTLGTLAPLIGAYLVAWQVMTGTRSHQVNLEPLFHVRFVAGSLPIFAANCLGIWLDERLAVRLGTLAVWSSAILYTARRSRRALTAWAVLMTCVALHMSMIALSAFRTSFFGLTMLRLDRYYFDAAFLVPIFAALALHAGASGRWEQWLSGPLPSRAPIVVAALALVVLMSSTSAASLRRIQATDGDYLAVKRSALKHGRATAGSYYPMHERARAFMSNLKLSLARIPPPRPLRVVDTRLPWHVMPWGKIAARSTELLVLMGEDVRADPDGYVVTPEGYLSPHRGGVSAIRF